MVSTSKNQVKIVHLVGLWNYPIYLHKRDFLGIYRNLQIGIYRDDGLAVVQLTDKGTEDLKKRISELFKSMGLKLTYKVNISSTDFLDVKLDLKSEEFKPYMKPIDIDKQSNYPPHIFKKPPSRHLQRIATNSSNEGIFKQAEGPYIEALKKSKFTDEDIKNGWSFSNRSTETEAMTNYKKAKKAKKARNMTYFTPPFNGAVSTNVISYVIKLVARCFTKENCPTLYKAFNRNNVTCTYRVGRNMKANIDAHNKALLNNKDSTTATTTTVTPAGELSNCRGGPSRCEVDGECRQRSNARSK